MSFLSIIFRCVFTGLWIATGAVLSEGDKSLLLAVSICAVGIVCEVGGAVLVSLDVKMAENRATRRVLDAFSKSMAEGATPPASPFTVSTAGGSDHE